MKVNPNTFQPLRAGREWFYLELHSMEYREAWNLQCQLVASRKDRIIDTDIVLCLEHPPVFTLGRRGGLSNLKVTEEFLKRAGIPVIQVERGGSITFHGPGQLVIYPIIDLREARLDIVAYVSRLEEVMIRAAADWGVKAERNPMNRGVWVGNNKLGSIGIAIRHGISFHGFAFNINLSLKPFSWILPCGLKKIGMTSLERELSKRVSMRDARETVKHHMGSVFECELVTTGLSELKSFLKNSDIKQTVSDRI